MVHYLVSIIINILFLIIIHTLAMAVPSADRDQKAHNALGISDTQHVAVWKKEPDLHSKGKNRRGE
jgi:hypothetical protein